MTTNQSQMSFLDSSPFPERPVARTAEELPSQELLALWRVETDQYHKAMQDDIKRQLVALAPHLRQQDLLPLLAMSWRPLLDALSDSDIADRFIEYLWGGSWVAHYVEQGSIPVFLSAVGWQSDVRDERLEVVQAVRMWFQFRRSYWGERRRAENVLAAVETWKRAQEDERELPLDLEEVDRWLMVAVNEASVWLAADEGKS